MKKELLALVFSDLHINLWAKFNENNNRTLNHFKVLRRMKELGNKLNVPILFCGDMLHKPESLDQDLVQIIQVKFDKIFTDICPPFLCISGNHDIKSLSRVDNKPYSWVSLLSRIYPHIIDLDYNVSEIANGVFVHGIPYIDHNIGLNTLLNSLDLSNGKHILIIHSDYPGAEDTDGRRVDSVENLNLNVLNKFDLVLCGHIHKPQRLSKKVYIIGAPIQQRRTDRDCELGYWKIYKDLSMKFVPLEGFPKFIDVEKEEDIKEDGNYYTVLPKKANIPTVSNHRISKQLSKKSIAHKYLRTKGIKDREKKTLLIKLLSKVE